jgi:Ca2+/Na+ antiporter
MISKPTYREKFITNMTNPRTPYFFHPAAPLLMGLIAAQIIATVHVYLSNLNLHHTLTLIRDSGYLTVPNQNVIPALKGFTPAFCGGLFFTLSFGAGLALLSIVAAWIWDRVFYRNRHFMVVLILLWTGLLFFINIHGFSLFATLYGAIIPLVVIGFSLRFMPKSNQHQYTVRVLIHMIPIIVLAGLWFTQYDRHLFLDLRDHLLFSNPIGKKVSDFYYAYTLHAAETFKSLNQKMLKTCRITQFPQTPPDQSLKKALMAQDYLPVETDTDVDLDVVREGDYLLLRHHGRELLKTTPVDMLMQAKKILNQFSLHADRYVTFRQLTFLSLLFGYPLTLYILFHALIWIFLRLFADKQKAATLTSILCLIISLCIFAAFSFSRSPKIEQHALMDALNSNHWQTRVAALRFIEENGLDIGRVKGYANSKSSTQIAERYWLAKALAKSRKKKTYDVVLELLNDSNVNVASMAYLALAQRGDAQAIREILKKIKVSDNWYSQMYAYRALRALGWTQDRSH